MLLNKVLEGGYARVDAHICWVCTNAASTTHLLARASSIANNANLNSICVQHWRTTVARACVSLWRVCRTSTELLILVCCWGLRSIVRATIATSVNRCASRVVVSIDG